MLNAKQLARLRRLPLDGPNKLQAAMDLAELTQVELAGLLGVPQPYVSKVKRGDYSRRGLPTETARRFADAFGCSIEDLFPARARQEVA